MIAALIASILVTFPAENQKLPVTDRTYVIGAAETNRKERLSTANDLAKFCRVILNGGITENGKKIFDKSFIDLTQTSWRDESGVARSFGWDKSRKSLPTNFSDNSITHSGWSGQSVFIDLERKRYVVVLTVRLSAYAKSKESRKEIASLIFED